MASKSEESLNSLCSLFRLLSDKTRLQIVMYLADGDRSVNNLCHDLKLAQPTVSHHLGLLRMNRVIVNKRSGKQVIYSLGSWAKGNKKSLKFDISPFEVTLTQG